MSDRLSTKQLQALPHIVAAASDKEGCEAAGISRNTFYRWANEPAFKAELAKQRENVVSGAMDILKGHFGQAVSTLVGLLKTENEGLRRQTAVSIIDYVLRLKEMTDIEQRLEKIENAIKR